MREIDSELLCCVFPRSALASTKSVGRKFRYRTPVPDPCHGSASPARGLATISESPVQDNIRCRSTQAGTHDLHTVLDVCFMRAIYHQHHASGRATYPCRPGVCIFSRRPNPPRPVSIRTHGPPIQPSLGVAPRDCFVWSVAGLDADAGVCSIHACRARVLHPQTIRVCHYTPVLPRLWFCPPSFPTTSAVLSR